MTSKNRVTVNLEEAEFEALQRIASKLDRPLAWVGRRAICDLIANEDQHEEEAPTLASSRRA